VSCQTPKAIVALISAINSTSGKIAPESADRTSAVVATCWTGFGPGEVVGVDVLADGEALPLVPDEPFPELGWLPDVDEDEPDVGAGDEERDELGT